MNVAQLEHIRAALDSAWEFVAEYSDVDDGPDGMQVPNRAMSLGQEIGQAIEVLSRELIDRAA